MRVLVALGGNALMSPTGVAAPADQVAAITRAVRPVVELVVAGHEVVLTHGNGPQVGSFLVQNEAAAALVPPLPLDWCGAQTQGTIGFVVLNALTAALVSRGACRPVAALVTRTLVDGADPGFRRPTKPVGRFLPTEQASALISTGQTWQDYGRRGWRRVVASPEPLDVLDVPAARALADAGYLVVVGGGGGIPCARDADGALHGVEAVVDKDLTATLLARAMAADVLVIATNVSHATTGWGTADQRDLGAVRVAELRALAAQGQFAEGSMGPKVEAACRFVEGGGRRAVICGLDAVAQAAIGAAGTVVSP